MGAGILKKILKARFFVGLILFGLIFTVIGGFLIMQPQQQQGEWIPVSATVESVSSQSSVDESTDYFAVITYSISDGISYTMPDWPVSSTTKAGDVIEIEYNSQYPESIRSSGAGFLPYVLIALGLIALVIGLRKVIIIIKTPSSEMNELDRTYLAKNVNPDDIEDVKNSTEERRNYYFHFTGKFGQSYILETQENRTPIFEAVCDKFSLLGASDYTFVNHITGTKKQTKIGHTVSISSGNGRFSVTTDAYFKVDGERCWDVLGKKGYSLVPHLDGINFVADINKFGINVARIEQAGANVMSPDKQTKLGDVLTTPGCYKVYCRESDIDGVFFACLCLTRARG